VIADPPAYADYYAGVRGAEEGHKVQLMLWAYSGMPQDLEYWFEDDTAELGVDYADNVTDYPVNSLWRGSGRLISIPTMTDSLPEGVESFYVHVQVIGHPETEIVVRADIWDPGMPAPPLPGGGGETPVPETFAASVMPATEGDPVLLYLAATAPASLEYWVEDVSAQMGLHYTADSEHHTVSVGPGQPVRELFPTIENTAHYHTRSFKIHVRPVGDAANEVVLEADIFDDDLHSSVLQYVSYSYDGFDRLVHRTVIAGGWTFERFFSWENGQVALQFDGSEGPGSETLSHRYLYGPAIDQIMADEQVWSLTDPGQVLWPLTDHLGSVRDIVTYSEGTDETTVLNHRVYDSFGNLTSGRVALSVPLTGVPLACQCWTEKAGGRLGTGHSNVTFGSRLPGRPTTNSHLEACKSAGQVEKQESG
jgi:hypothetical protein